jgi:predicted permease
MLRAWHRLLAVFKKSALDAEFDDEAESHITLATDDYIDRGMSLPDARRLARLKFGSTAASKDLHRDSRGFAWLDGVLFDLRLALRALRRDRVYTVTAIVMLTVALALNATVFTVTDAMLFRGFPHVSRNDRLLYIQERCGAANCGVSYADFEVWRAAARSFEELSFLGTRVIALRDGDGRFADLTTRIVSANLFGMLGVAPLLGRDFTEADEVDGSPRTAIITYRLWQGRYGARPDVIGSTVQINGIPTVIIAVMPEGFDFTSETSMWVPVVRTRDLSKRGSTPGSHVVVGRLRDGVSMTTAEAELESINQRLATAYPDTNQSRVPKVFTHAQFISGPDAQMIWGSLWAGSWFVLLIACANLANLTLVRSTGRWREFVTTIALGAGQARMIRQIAFESLLLTIVAVPIAWGITTSAIRAWATATASPHQILDYAVGARTFTYLVAVAIACAVLFATAPILRMRRLGVSGALKSDARGVTQSPWSRHLSSGLVAVQMTLAIVLLAGAGVLLRSLANISDADTGLRDPQRVLVGMLRMPSLKFPDTQARFTYLESMTSLLRTIPEIESVSLTASIPTKGGGRRRFEIERRDTDPQTPLAATSVTVGPEYFQVLRKQPVAGREFNDGDRAGSTPVAVVNEKLAADFLPGESVVGRRLRFIDDDGTGVWRTIVGVVPTILEGDALRQHPAPVVYTPFHQEIPARAVFVVARSSGDPAVVAPFVRSRLHSLDADVLVEGFSTLKQSFVFNRDSMDFEHSELGKHATVAPVFAGIALLLSAVGLFAVLAHSVNQRMKEIGIRIAIGASTLNVMRLILVEGMRPVAAGLVVGVLVSIAMNRLMQSELVGLSPYDPTTMVAAPLVLIAVSVVACQLPARRAARVDPAIILRDQ